MRAAELVMAIVLGVFSLYLMSKSAELPIGWIPGEGPGGGAWPFWLAAGMLFCCIAIVYRWARRITPESRSEEVYMDSRTLELILLNVGALTAMIGLFHIVGAYGAIPVFLVFYKAGNSHSCCTFNQHLMVAYKIFHGVSYLVLTNQEGTINNALAIIKCYRAFFKSACRSIT